MSSFAELSTPAGAISAGHPLTAEAGAHVLTSGGTACDAAVAAMAMSCLAEPVLSSPAGGGFALIQRPGEPPTALDFFAQTPRQRNTSLVDGGATPIVADYGTVSHEYLIGPGSVATPGFIPGLLAIHEFGGSIDLAELFAPTVSAARIGVEVSAFQHHVFVVVNEILNATPKCQALFAPGGVPLDTGAAFINPGLADAFELIAAGRVGVDEVVSAMVAMQHGTGHLSADDFAQYTTEFREPVSAVLGGYRVWLNPLPAAGGVYVANTLSYLNEHGADAVAMRNALARTDADRQRVAGSLSALAGLAQRQRGTTHFSVVDRDGVMVSVTLSIGEGNGELVGDFGFMFNNMLGEPDVNPGGATGWPLDVRLSSMMCPTLVEHPDGTVTGLGTGGSSRIRSALAQAVDHLRAGTGLKAVVDAPRMHVEDHKLDMEAHYGDAVIDGLSDGFPDHRVWQESNMFFGGINAVQRHPGGGVVAVADHRRGGFATVSE